ncbi:MFS transporter [Paenibacillus athensensis]|nr:MFS transporter [Paenibacillus athensensis]
MRLLHGIGWGISTTAYGTMAAVLIPAARRGEGMSGWGFGMALTMAFGPLLGNALLSAYGFGAVVTVSAALTLLALLLAPLVGTPPRKPVILSSDEMTGEAGWRRWLEPVTLKPAALHALLGFSYGGD